MIGQKSVVTDAHEAFWEYVKKKPTNELLGIDRHGALTTSLSIVFVTKGDFAVYPRRAPRENPVQNVTVGRGLTQFPAGEAGIMWSREGLHFRAS